MRGRPVVAYLAVAYGFTWVVMLPHVLEARGLAPALVPHRLEALAAFGPFLAAWLVLRGSGDPVALAAFRDDLRRWRAPGAAWALALGSPLLFLALALGAAAAAAGGASDLSRLASGPVATAAGFAELLVVGSLLQSVGEEPGWRGWLLPRLRATRGPLAATLRLFPAWLLWHVPMFLARPEFGPGQFAGFALGILSAAVWLTAVREASGSTLHAIAWHAAANLTRGVALAVSTAAFLAYGLAVALGASVIAAAWVHRARLAAARAALEA